ncbi:MAG: radical SAM protein [Methanobacteriota archaeon]
MPIEFIEAKSLVRVNKRSGDVNLNPYQGCFHDCAYCDGKAERYNMHEDFATRLRAKANAPELLEKFLRGKGFSPVNRERTGTLADFSDEAKKALRGASPRKFTINISGGVCDIYQPAEAEIGLSRRLMQLVYDYDFPIFLLTKNKLVLKDLDLLRKINVSQGATVAMSVTLADESLREKFEPGASTTQERFETLRTLHESGIKTGIWALPLLPWIGDTDVNVDAIISCAKESGVDWMIFSGLTLKPGRQKEAFMRLIAKDFPGLEEKYRRLYANESKYGTPDLEAARAMGLPDPWLKGKRMAKKYGIAYKSWRD